MARMITQSKRQRVRCKSDATQVQLLLFLLYSSILAQGGTNHDSMETKKQAMVALKKEFKQAIKFVLATEGDDPRVTQLVKLRFYAYFKQGTEGKCKGTRPSIFSPLKRLMWESWNRLGKMKKKKAMQLYIKELDKLETNWRDPNWKRSKL